MRGRALTVGLLFSAGGVLACEGRQITVFDVPAKVGGAGSAGTGGAEGGGDAGSGGRSGNSSGAQSGAGNGGSQSGNSSVTGGSLGEGGSGASDGGTRCIDDFECGLGWRCAKDGCAAVEGVCEPTLASDCPLDQAPVCGCNGVTYWNDCIRRQSGMQLDFIGECGAKACSCEIGADCEAPYASCSHLLRPDEFCGHGPGTCWVLPLDCPDEAPPPGSKRWRQCMGPEMPLGPCVNTCLAIASERTHIQTHRDDPCF